MVNVSSWSHTFPSNLGSSFSAETIIPIPPLGMWLSGLIATLVPPLVVSGPILQRPESPQWLYLYSVPFYSLWGAGRGDHHPHTNAASLRASTQSGDEDEQSTGAVNTTLQTWGKGKCGLPLTPGYLLPACDSQHCRVQGTRCGSVVRIWIKLIPAFMCLADKTGAVLGRQTWAVPHWWTLW